MKVFSVFVLCFYMRSVYSYYMGSSVPINPAISSNVYPISNSQNIIQPIRPESQTSRLPAGDQNLYPGIQKNIRNEAKPTQYQYRMGPGFPVPYQNPQTAPGIKSNVLRNPKPGSGVIPHPVLQRIKLSPYLRQMYKTSFPTKRYTVVHPNGTIEHTDEIQAVKARYPSYHMVKSTDIIAHVDQLDKQRRASENTLPSQTNKPATTTSQSYERTSINSQESYNIQSETNRFRRPVVSNGNPVNPVYLNGKAQETIVKSTDIPNNLNNVSFNSAGSGTHESGIKQKIQDVNKVPNAMIEKTAYNNNSNVIAANPLPIYPTTSVSDVSPEKNVQPSEYPAVTKGAGDAVAVLDSNSTNINTGVDNQIFEIKQTELIEPTTEVQLPIDTSQHQALEVILPEILPQSTTGEMQTPTTIEGPVRSKIKPEVTTIEESITTHSANLSAVNNDTSTLPKLANVLESNVVIDVSQSPDIENLEPIDTSKTPTTTTNTTATVEVHQKTPNANSNSTAPLQNSTVPSVPNQSSTLFRDGAPLTWFELSENSVWDAIRNNSANVYFFFLPPKPKRVKEIRTTVYPNGTTVEQIIETDVYQDKDGIPKVTKS